MNMDETKLYSWFLGPKAENADMLERLVLEALRDCVFWRRNFHPEDDIIITEKCKREDAFQDSQALARQEFLALLANLKRDIPFYSPRYIGHMLGDQLLPAIAAYFAAMLHNPNNVTLEASPITTRYEMEVAQQLARLMGYSGETWGHITSGGTIANFEALWVARNLKYFPIAARDAARALALEELPVTLLTGRIRFSLRICETPGQARATARRQRSYRGGIDRNEATSHQIRAGSLVDTSDRLTGRRGDLFRVSHARLLSSLSANTECQRRSTETAGGVSIFDYCNGFGGAVVAAPQ